jgi:hypothetical protein
MIKRRHGRWQRTGDVRRWQVMQGPLGLRMSISHCRFNISLHQSLVTID